ncbi:hypothetical protein GTA62_14760 [Roseobacter sp. HKCCD9010]|uniref:hypothetical protein n=1 Tax=unclassified Roseobacter TaxID=196798 RepID=UPI00149176A1|nr:MULTISPECIES: hypothetical protein [unclassified Roseobacter]MBF9050628.1 hypothetical protein [Rhodobacterales bacterium HKCCD4356]NNV11954.1 hypothetical protein [Roseobacter sp. HKCCD7357]NNV16967.1 hypothetical protein [Roseobacter sp. HKCCD8768]NNV26196.1 hypothetical protein [Roseobacter sp. HKCCD8192]NNV30691.1 hypothetical protein [Roseobacter sp. HKCCD9061]
MDRRTFIHGLAAALPAGAAATQIKAETDPIRAACLTLKEAISVDAPEGMEVFHSIIIHKEEITAIAFPPNYDGAGPKAHYQSSRGWEVEA